MALNLKQFKEDVSNSFIIHTHTHTQNILISQVAQMVKNLSVMQETQVWSLGLEDPLEKGLLTNSSISTWKIPWTEEPGRL